MKIKVFIATSALLIGTQGAKSEGVSRSLDGLSMGAQIGLHTQSSKIKQRFKIAPGYQKRKDLGGEGLIGGLNLAYGHIFPNHLFLGAEIKGELSDMGGTTSEGPFDLFQNRIHLKMNNSYGAALKMGGVISSVLPYFRVGILSSKWNSSSRVSIDADTGGGKKHKRLLGLELGLGVDIPLPESVAFTDRLSIGGEFTHVEYQKFSYKNVIHDPNEVPGDCTCDSIFKVSAKPRTNTFMLRLRYRLY